MPLNLIKKYNKLLELNQYTERERIISLKNIFYRDITNNADFKFRTKTIRPIKKRWNARYGNLVQASNL